MEKRKQTTLSTQLSKSLSYLLRHGAEREGLQFLPGGFLYVEDILTKPQFKRFNTKDIIHVVNTNEKQRFHLETDSETDRLKIRANQGHSLLVADLALKPITSAETFPVVIHGTYRKFWDSIKHQGLKRMRRIHIHFAPGEPGEDGVVSGQRTNCDLLIYLDLGKALQSGLEFFLSANNVILSAGDVNGVIVPTFFQKAVDLKTGQDLLQDKGEKSQDKETAVLADNVAEEIERQRRARRKKKT